MVAQVRSEKSRPSRDYCAHRVGLIARVSAVCLAPSIVSYLSRPHLAWFGVAATAAIVASGAHGTKSASSADPRNGYRRNRGFQRRGKPLGQIFPFMAIRGRYCSSTDDLASAHGGANFCLIKIWIGHSISSSHAFLVANFNLRCYGGASPGYSRPVE